MTFKTARLSTRLLIASAVVLPLFLGFSAYTLDLAFKKSLIAAEQDRLKGHIYLLLAAADIDDGELELPQRLTEPLFSQLNSGLYAYVHDASGKEIWRSLSASVLDLGLKQDSSINPGAIQFKPYSIGQDEFYIFSFDVAYELADATVKLYRFNVLHIQQGIQSELFAYRKQLWWLLGGLALLLLATQTWIMRWGLQPLKVVAMDLRDVEQGQSDFLRGRYPGEIQPVIANLNRLLKTERTQRERYKNTLADLAHSLKTPLAVLRGALEQPLEKIKLLLDEQISRMDQIIRHQLQRAVINNRSQIGKSTDVSALIKRVNEALSKVYQDKGVNFQLAAEGQHYFYGSESDLMELFGNILDNAYKYSKHTIRIGVTSHDSELIITVEDDGPGIEESDKEYILARGARADSVQPGHGIGLSIATDILSSYKGGLSVEESSLGGAKFTLVFPI